MIVWTELLNAGTYKGKLYREALCQLAAGLNDEREDRGEEPSGGPRCRGPSHAPVFSSWTEERRLKIAVPRPGKYNLRQAKKLCSLKRLRLFEVFTLIPSRRRLNLVSSHAAPLQQLAQIVFMRQVNHTATRRRDQ